MPDQPTHAWQFNGVVRLTRIGTGFLLGTVFVGFAAINTGNNALYIGLAFMLACLLISGIASKGGLKHLRITLEGIDEAWAGRPSPGRLRVENSSRIWNVRDVIVISDELAAPLFLPLLRQRQAQTVDAPFLFKRRGIAQLHSLDLYTRYPFAFFLKKRRVRLAGEVLVFPRLLGDDALRERFRPVDGENYQSNRPGPGSEIHSFRDYVRGDSLRQVYWKKSASIGRWIVKQTEIEAARAVHVLVDPFKPRTATDDDFELMVSAAATFIHQALQRELEVALTLPRLELQAQGGKGGTGALAMFRALALIEPLHEPLSLTIDRGTVLFAVHEKSHEKGTEESHARATA
jgi:uncharacterized protein (DUF58 family)